MRISKWTVPPGGWIYMQGETVLAGDSFDELVSLITSHRRSNNIQIGNVPYDIQDQLLKLHPSLEVDVIKIKSDGP